VLVRISFISGGSGTVDGRYTLGLTQ
jgi:hypothetical protein